MTPERALEFVAFSNIWLRDRIKRGGDCSCQACYYCAYLLIKEALHAKTSKRLLPRPGTLPE